MNKFMLQQAAGGGNGKIYMIQLLSKVLVSENTFLFSNKDIWSFSTMPPIVRNHPKEGNLIYSNFVKCDDLITLLQEICFPQNIFSGEMLPSTERVKN
jgi:hypothetical protein